MNICNICGKQNLTTSHLTNMFPSFIETCLCEECYSLCERIEILDRIVFIHPRQKTKAIKQLLDEFNKIEQAYKEQLKEYIKISNKVLRKLKQHPTQLAKINGRELNFMEKKYGAI